MANNSTVKDATQKAADALDKLFDDTGGIEDGNIEHTTDPESTEEEPTTEGNTESTEVKPKKEEISYSDDLEVDEVVKARQLFKALKDPAQSGLVIDFLAQKAGYQKPPETKTEIKEQKKAINEYVKEALGEEFAFIGDKLGPALQAWAKDQQEEFDNKLAEKVKPIEQRDAENVRAGLEAQASAAQDTVGIKYYKDGKIPENILDSMSKLMDQLKPEAGTTMQDYIENVFLVAAARNGGVPILTSDQKKIDKSKDNAPNNLRNASRPQAGKVPVVIKTVKDAVQLAHEEVMKSMKAS